MKFRPTLLALLLSGALAGQDGSPVFKSRISLVRIDAEVVSSAGLPVSDLHKEDFRVFDDGAEQRITAFSFEEEPLDLILLFDLSGSMKGKLLEIVRAVELGFHELKSGDRVCVMSFQREPREIAPFTADLDSVNQAILLQVMTLRFAGNSDPQRAAAGAALRFQGEPGTGRRRAILMVTDKGTGRSPSVIRDLWKSDAVMGELLIEKAQATSVRQPEAGNMADESGGEVVVAGPPGPSFQQAIRLLRKRYTLYYSGPEAASGTERAIAVKLDEAAARRLGGARLRFRKGYLVP